MLQCYVVARIGYDDYNSREELIKCTIDLHGLKKIRPPDKVPMQKSAYFRTFVRCSFAMHMHALNMRLLNFLLSCKS